MGCDLCRESVRAVEDLIVADLVVDEADAMGLGAVDDPAGVEELSRFAQAYQRGEPLDRTGSGDNAQTHLRLAPFAAGARDPEITGHGEFAAATEGIASHRGYGNQPVFLQLTEKRCVDAPKRIVAAPVFELADVRASGEGLVAGAGEHDGAGTRIGGEVGEMPPECVDDRLVDRVARLRAVQGKLSDKATCDVSVCSEHNGHRAGLMHKACGEAKLAAALLSPGADRAAGRIGRVFLHAADTNDRRAQGGLSFTPLHRRPIAEARVQPEREFAPKRFSHPRRVKLWSVHIDAQLGAAFRGLQANRELLDPFRAVQIRALLTHIPSIHVTGHVVEGATRRGHQDGKTRILPSNAQRIGGMSTARERNEQRAPSRMGGQRHPSDYRASPGEVAPRSGRITLHDVELIVFDLDGTLLNASGALSSFTRETLSLMDERGMLFTVATGRALHGARQPLSGYPFRLPQAFKNGVVIWDPGRATYTHSWFLTASEASQSIEWLRERDITPFVFTIDREGAHELYHAPVRTPVDELLLKDFGSRPEVDVRPLAELPEHARVSNVSAIGEPAPVDAVAERARATPGLVAYSSSAIESGELHWIDIHHIGASKGSAVELLKRDLGANRVIVFGDSYNDESMFAIADEAYAPENAKAPILERATQVIGHHDSDGIARFLRERFSLAA